MAFAFEAIVSQHGVTTTRMRRDAMQTTTNNERTFGWFTRSTERPSTAARHRNRLLPLIAMVASVTCGMSFAQSIVGTPGAGYQTWTAAADLNNNHAPYWDNQSISF